MQVIEKSVEGLRRTYGVTVPSAELDALLDARIAEITPRLRLKGFRPGKVPAAHVRRVYGKALMGEVVEQTLNETSQKVLDDNSLRVAAQPDLKPPVRHGEGARRQGGPRLRARGRGDARFRAARRHRA